MTRDAAPPQANDVLFRREMWFGGVKFWYHSQGMRTSTISQPELIDFQSKLASMESAAGLPFRRLHLGSEEEPRLVRVVKATPQLLPLLGVAPAEGRFFTADESLPDGPSVVVITDRMRRQLFAASSQVVGESMTLGGVPHTIVGVMPPGFGFPNDEVAGYRPFRMDPANPDLRNNHYLFAIAKLRPRATLAAACAEIDSYGRWAVAEYPEYYSGFNASFDVSSLRDTFVGATRTPLFLALGAVCLVLLIACANVANLMLARGEERRREMAVRLALGATQRHLARQLLAESVALGLLGAIVALPLMWAVLEGLKMFSPSALPRLDGIAVDAPVLAYTAAIALVTSLLFGLAPLIKAWRSDLRNDLQGGVRAVSASHGSVKLRRVLVAGQVALAVVLIAGASLLTRTVVALYTTDVGFETDGSIAVRASLPPHVYENTAQIVGFINQLEERARSLPGVTEVGVINTVPLWYGFNNTSLQVEGRIVESVGEAPTAMIQKLTPGALSALDLQVRQGRFFTQEDVRSGRRVAIVNEAFVRTVLKGSNPFTTQVRMYSSDRPWLEIIGVVKDYRQLEMVGESWPQLMVPMESAGECTYHQPTNFSLLVRSAGSPQLLAEEMRSLVREVGTLVVILEVRTLADIKRDAVGERSFLASALAIAAGLALVLAAVGLYGIVALWVSERSRELGLRMALGAMPSTLWRLVLLQAAQPVLIGMSIGMVAAVLLGFWLRRLLHEVSPADPASLLLVFCVLVGTAGIAALATVRRATRIDPSTILQAE